MSKPVVGIHHVAIRAAEFDRTLSLYTSVFGMTPVLSWGDAGHRAIMLDVGDGSRLEIFEGGAQDQPEGAWCHLALAVPDCRAVYAAALAAGCVSTVEPKDVLISGVGELPATIAFVKGYSGEILEFFETRQKA